MLRAGKSSAGRQHQPHHVCGPGADVGKVRESVAASSWPCSCRSCESAGESAMNMKDATASGSLAGARLNGSSPLDTLRSTPRSSAAMPGIWATDAESVMQWGKPGATTASPFCLGAESGETITSSPAAAAAAAAAAASAAAGARCPPPPATRVASKPCCSGRGSLAPGSLEASKLPRMRAAEAAVSAAARAPHSVPSAWCTDANGEPERCAAAKGDAGRW